MTSLIILIAITYILGSIPTAFIYGKLKGKDIRKEGSGNVGATNAGRIFGKKAFFLIFVLDFLKGFIPVYFFKDIFSNIPYSTETVSIIILFSALFGHVFSIFINFKGGKGVATSLGGIFAFMPFASFFSVIIFLLIFKVKKIVSLSSMIGAICLPVSCFFIYESKIYFYFALFLAIFIIFTHRANIKRLIAGEEKKII